MARAQEFMGWPGRTEVARKVGSTTSQEGSAQGLNRKDLSQRLKGWRREEAVGSQGCRVRLWDQHPTPGEASRRTVGWGAVLTQPLQRAELRALPWTGHCWATLDHSCIHMVLLRQGFSKWVWKGTSVGRVWIFVFKALK